MSETSGPSIRHTALMLGRRWRLLARFTAVAGVAAAAYALLAPTWYQAQVSVVPTSQSSDGAGVLMGMAKDLPEELGIAAGISSDSERIASVFRSNSVADTIIKEFDLKKKYGEQHTEDVRRQLWKHCQVEVDRKASLISLTCEDQEPKTAQAMTKRFANVSKDKLRQISSGSAREEREFLADRLSAARDNLKNAADALREFQEKNGVVDLDEQSKAVISAMASLEGERLSKQLKLSYLDQFSGPSESSVSQLRTQIRIVEKQLEELRKGNATPDSSGSKATSQKELDVFPALAKVPEIGLQLRRLQRELDLRERIFVLLTMRYELAKVSEARNTSSFQVLDAPTLPTEKARPKRRLIVVFGGIAGFLLGAAWIFLTGWWRGDSAAAA